MIQKLILIGLVAGFSGSDPNTAREFQRGWDVFRELHPEFAREVAVEAIDTRGHAETGLNAVREAIDKKIQIFVGFHDSNEAIAVSQLIEDRKALLITPFSSNPTVTAGRKQVFSTCPSDSMHGKVLAQFVLKEFRLKRMLVLANRDSVYSQGLAQIFIDELGHSKRAPKIVREYYGKDDLKLEALKSFAASEGVDSVFIPDHVTRAGLIIGKLAEYSRDLTVFGGDGLGGRRLLEAASTGKFPKHVFYSYPWDENWAASIPSAAPFLRTYRQLFPGEPISSGAALAYDAFQLLEQALKGLKPRDDLGLVAARALEKAQVEGTGGALAYKGEHAPARQILIMTLKNGKHEVYRRITP